MLLKTSIFTVLLLALPLLQFSLFSVLLYVLGVVILYLTSSTGRYALFFSYWIIAVFSPLGLYLLYIKDIAGLSSTPTFLILALLAGSLWWVWLGLVEFIFDKREVAQELFFIAMLYIVSLVSLGYFPAFGAGLWLIVLWLIFTLVVYESLLFRSYKGVRARVIAPVMAFIITEVVWAVLALPFLSVLTGSLLVAVVGFIVFDTFMISSKGELDSSIIIRQVALLTAVTILVL